MIMIMTFWWWQCMMMLMWAEWIGYHDFTIWWYDNVFWYWYAIFLHLIWWYDNMVIWCFTILFLILIPIVIVGRCAASFAGKKVFEQKRFRWVDTIWNKFQVGRKILQNDQNYCMWVKKAYLHEHARSEMSLKLGDSQP